MPYHHIAHLDRFAPNVKVGMKLRKGDLLGYCGKSGTSSSHCHYEVTVSKPKSYVSYIWGWTLEQVKAFYIDPAKYLTNTLPMKWNTFGYKYGQAITNADGRKGFHPGVDLNFGSGSQDLGFEIGATTDGEIVYMGTYPNDGSWGNHIWWEEKDGSDQYDNHLIQVTQEGFEGVSGAFALVYGAEKHIVKGERAGLAALTVQSRKMPYVALNKTQWDSIPTGNNF